MDYEQDIWNRQVLHVGGHTELGLRPGGFRESLITTAFRADKDNLKLLEKGFPLMTGAVDEYKNGDLVNQYEEMEGV